MKLTTLAMAAAVAVVAATPAAALEKARVTRPTFIDPEVVAQLPKDLADRMVADSDTFYLPDSPETHRSQVGAPLRVRFAEERGKEEAPTPVVAPPVAHAQPVAEPRRATDRTAADDARRRRDFEAWEERRQELQAVQVEQSLQQQQQQQQQPRFQEVAGAAAAPPAPRATDDGDDQDAGEDDDEDLTPAQAQLENNRRRARAQARMAAEQARQAAATQTAAMRFAEARRAGRPVVRAYPPAGAGAGTYDLAGNVMQSRLQRAAARREERERAEDRRRGGPAAGETVLLETAAERPHRRMFEMTADELRAAFHHHREAAAGPSPAPVAERLRARMSQGPSDMPPMEAAPAQRAPVDPSMIEEHGIRVTRYEPPTRS